MNKARRNEIMRLGKEIEKLSDYMDEQIERLDLTQSEKAKLDEASLSVGAAAETLYEIDDLM